MKISIIGAGAFGTAMGIALAQNNNDIFLWSHKKKVADTISYFRENKKYLKTFHLPKNITPTHDLKLSCFGSDAIVMCIPAQKTSFFLEKFHPFLPRKPLILCAKGIEEKTLLLQSDIAKNFLPKNEIAILTGPSFAQEIANGKPTALALACSDQRTGQKLQTVFSTKTIRVYLNTDVIGCQLGGSLKNVIAIACGVATGLNLGESARMALMTRGFSETCRLGLAMGGSMETFLGLSGMGDLALTCNSPHSRNFKLGIALAKNKPFSKHTTVEGILTTKAACELAKKYKVKMPIVKIVSEILEKNLSATEAMNKLFFRPLTKE